MMDLQKLISDQENPLGSLPATEYSWMAKRLKSLEDWPMAKPSAQDMAEAGFYNPNPDAAGSDSVRCFSCFIELDGWEPTDNPWDEHKKRALALNPPCKFIEIGKKEKDLTVDDYLEILKSAMIRTWNDKCEKNLKAVLSLHRKKKSALKKDLQKMGIA